MPKRDYMQSQQMFDQISKPTRGRVITAVLLSLFFLRLPELMPSIGKWLVVAVILIFFLGIQEQKGMKGGVIAGMFSLAFAGFGQLYVREYTRGVFFILFAVFAYMTTGYSSKAWVLNVIIFIFAAIDAFSFGKRGIGIF